MPKIQWERLPSEKWAHLRDRAKERRISAQNLFELAERKSQDPDVPDGDWYKTAARDLRVADEAWLALALLQKENPARA